MKAFFTNLWAKIKAFFAAIADFFQDEKKRFSSGRLLKIGAGILAGVIAYAVLFTAWIPADRLATLLPEAEKAVTALLVFALGIHISQNASGQ